MNDVIKKSHQFVTARLQLTAREQDFVTLLMKAVKKSADDIKYSLDDVNENFEYERIPTKFLFTTTELANLFQVTPSALYHSLDELTDSLMGKVAYLKNPEKGSFEKAVLFSDVSYYKGILTLEVSRSTAAKMLDYSNGFAEIDLKLLFSLKGAYEKRILEILSRFKNQRDFKVSIDDYSLMIGSSRDRYKTFSDFRKVVIERPLLKIITKSNGVWTPKDDAKKGYELVKKGRSYSHIIFKMQWNEPTSKKEKQKILPQSSPSELIVDDAIKTYSDLMNKERLPSTAELNNLMSFMGQLMLEGFEFGSEFLTLFKTAQDANSQLDGE